MIAFPVRLLAGDFPSWRTHLYWYLLLGSLLFASSRTGRNPYCPWICPFGAAQDVIGLPLGARRRRIPHALLFAWVKGALLWLAVFLGLLYRSPGGASYEVFAMLFRLSGTGFQAAILVIVLLAALLFSRHERLGSFPGEPGEPDGPHVRGAGPGALRAAPQGIARNSRQACQ